MGERLILSLGYGAVFVATALWLGHRFWLRDRVRLVLAAQGSSALAALSLVVGLALYGFRVGYWPFQTAYELLNVGLVGVLLASLTLLSPARDDRLLLILSALSSLLAAYALWAGRLAEPTDFAPDGPWRRAYVALSSFGGGALAVAGVAAVFASGGEGEDSMRGRVVARRALAWSLLTLSAGLASGAWWFQRLWGRYWGDTRWTAMVVVGLAAAAAWHGRTDWLGRGRWSIVVGVIVGLAGGCILLGLGSRG